MSVEGSSNSTSGEQPLLHDGEVSLPSAPSTPKTSAERKPGSDSDISGVIDYLEIGSASVFSPQDPSDSDDLLPSKQNTSATEGHPALQSATLLPAAASPTTAEEKSAAKKRLGLGTFDQWLERIVAVATTLGVGLLCLQIKQTNQALGEAREANRIAREAQADAASDVKEQRERFKQQLDVAMASAKAAQDAAVAAQISAQSSALQVATATAANEISERTAAEALAAFQREQRARFVFKSIELFHGFDGAVGASRGTVSYSNAGKTPAMNVRIQATVDRGPETRRIDWSVFESSAEGSMGPSDEPRTLVASTVWPANDMRMDFRSGSGPPKEIFVRVRTDYCDTFGRRHWQVACFAWGGYEFKKSRICSSEESAEPGEACR